MIRSPPVSHKLSPPATSAVAQIRLRTPAKNKENSVPLQRSRGELNSLAGNRRLHVRIVQAPSMPLLNVFLGYGRSTNPWEFSSTVADWLGCFIYRLHPRHKAVNT